MYVCVGTVSHAVGPTDPLVVAYRPTPSESRNGGTVTDHPWQRNATLAINMAESAGICGLYIPAGRATVPSYARAVQPVGTAVDDLTTG
jgi:hypothetical protein